MQAAPSYSVMEKRKYPRYSLPLNLFINQRTENGDSQCDISYEGTGFISNHIFKSDDFVFFHFSGKSNTHIENIKFSVLGRIVWVSQIGENQYKYGAQFKFYNDPFSRQQQVLMKTVINQYSMK